MSVIGIVVGGRGHSKKLRRHISYLCNADLRSRVSAIAIEKIKVHPITEGFAKVIHYEVQTSQATIEMYNDLFHMGGGWD